MRNKLAIVTWLWGKRYTRSNVARLKAQTEKHLSIAHEFICITDRPLDIEGVREIKMPLNDKKQRLRRLVLFSKELQKEINAEWIFQIDVDTTIINSIDHLITFTDNYIWKCPSIGSRGYAYGPGLMLFQRGTLNHIWDKWKAHGEKLLSNAKKEGWTGSDQAVISSFVHEKIKTWTDNDGLYSYRDHIHKKRTILDKKVCMIQYYGPFDYAISPYEKPELTCVTFLYDGFRKGVYSWRHVHALRRMVGEYLGIPHRFVCITNKTPEDVGCEVYPLWPFPSISVKPGHPNNFRCLKLFDVAEEIAGGAYKKLLVFDLDVLIRKRIDQYVTNDTFKSIEGRFSPYNSSLYLLQAGTHKNVWNSFDPETATKILNQYDWVGSDQSWMSHMIRDAPTWGTEDGVYNYSKHCKRKTPKNARFIYYAGGIKPWDLKKASPLGREYDAWYKEGRQAVTQGLGRGDP
jgi:hypothetical protein